MNTIIYDASLLAGTAAAGAGAWVQFGAGVGLMVTGGLVIGLTVFSAFLVRGRG